jgi:hypothetical protein
MAGAAKGYALRIGRDTTLGGLRSMSRQLGSQELSFDSLGIIAGTDKSSLGHDYLRHYERIFSQFRDQPINVIEIGVSRGASLRIWPEYFRTATIIGIDIRPEYKQHEKGRVTVEIGSQDDPEFLAQVCTKYPPTIIIDDGSHRADHVLFALERMFPMLLPGGIYVIEDLFFHVGAAEQQNRGPSSVSPADYITTLILRLFAGNLNANEGHGFMKYLFDKTDHVEIIRQAAVLWKQSSRGRGLSVAEADQLIETIETADGLDGLALFLLRRGGNPDRAEVAVRKAMRIAPSLTDLLSYRLSMVLERQRRWDEALAMARQAAELNPAYGQHLSRLRSDQLKRQADGTD